MIRRPRRYRNEGSTLDVELDERFLVWTDLVDVDVAEAGGFPVCGVPDEVGRAVFLAGEREPESGHGGVATETRVSVCLANAPAPSRTAGVCALFGRISPPKSNALHPAR